jgi:hypothetical protein
MTTRGSGGHGVKDLRRNSPIPPAPYQAASCPVLLGAVEHAVASTFVRLRPDAL